jgi:predicted PurR-regulated permease PerM
VAVGEPRPTPDGAGAPEERRAPASERPHRYGEVLFAFALILGAVFVYQTAFILKPFVFALLVGLALEPAVAWLARRRVNRYVAALAVVLAAGGVVTLLVMAMAPVVGDQVRLLAEQGPGLVRRATASLEGLARRFPAIGDRISARTVFEPLLGQVGEAFPLLGRVFGAVARLALDTVIVLFLLIFGLGRPDPIRRVLAAAVPARFAPEAGRVMARVVPQLRAWVIGLAVAMLVIGLMTLIALLLLDVPYAFAFALLAGLLEVVPLVGPILSAVPPAVVAAADDPVKALWVVLAFFGIQQFENHVLIPLVMSRALALHPVLIAFLLLVMTYYLGPFGTFIAVPTAVVVAALYEEVYLPRARPEGAPPAP